MMNKCKTLLLALLFVSSGMYAAKQAPITNLDASNAEKREIRHGQLGFRSTLLFYTFKNQKAILKILINNKNKDFPVTSTIYIFDDTVTEKGMKKWLNNQHSDGLFPDVPSPAKTIKVPAKTCKVTSSKLIDKSQQQFGKFANYDITLKVNDYTDNISVKLKGFTVDTKVHIKL